MAFALAVASCGGSEPADSPLSEGRTVYGSTCSACHGPEGLGIEGLGKNFVGSPFITDQTTAELVAFIKVGRPADDPANTTGVAMLPKGGNPSLTDADLTDIVHFLKSLTG